MKADRLLGPEMADVDGIVEQRKSTISVFNGPPPTIQTFDSTEAEAKSVSDWLKARTQEGLLPHEVAIFVRSGAELERARAAAELAAIPYKILDDRVETVYGKASIATMHLAKGLEFRAVAVMACDDEIISLQQRIETVADDSDLEEVYNTERQLLYVAGTRAHFNIAGYKEWVKNVQRAEFPVVGGHSIAVTINVPKATVQGFEVDTGIVPVDWLELGGSGMVHRAPESRTDRPSRRSRL